MNREPERPRIPRKTIGERIVVGSVTGGVAVATLASIVETAGGQNPGLAKFGITMLICLGATILGVLTGAIVSRSGR